MAIRQNDPDCVGKLCLKMRLLLGMGKYAWVMHSRRDRTFTFAAHDTKALAELATPRATLAAAGYGLAGVSEAILFQLLQVLAGPRAMGSTLGDALYAVIGKLSVQCHHLRWII